MVTRTKPTEPPPEEAHVIVDVPYNVKLAFPASVASILIACVKLVEEEWRDNSYCYTLTEVEPQFRRASAEKMIAAAVNSKLKEDT